MAMRHLHIKLSRCPVAVIRHVGFGKSLRIAAVEALRLLSPLCFMLASTGMLPGQVKINFQDHVLPVIENHCGKCHNSDKKKGDLDLSNYGALLTGGASGKVVVAGDPDGSKIFKVITHAEEPAMPPNRPKIPDKDLTIVKQWIVGGLLETATGKAVAAQKSAVDFTLATPVAGRPEGPPPMPGALPLETVVETTRANAVTGLAASPWAPLFAVTGQKQVLLIHAETLEILGILPFIEGQPQELSFSRNGKLLLAGGGRPAKAGRVVVWDITSGKRLMVVGDEFDSILGADMSPDQSLIAMGGPGRLVKIFDTKTGALVNKIKKHTDWVTAIAFSPDGRYLASADRNGGIIIWDPDNAQEMFTLAGHKAAITSLSWRSDGNLLASSGEDGAIKLWEMREGKQAKTWEAHKGGALSVAYAVDGKLVSSGRDNTVTAWSGDGVKLRSFDFAGELPVRAAFSHDGSHVMAADWNGKLTVWKTSDGKLTGELNTNPPRLVTRLAASEKRILELESMVKNGATQSPEAQAALQKAEQDKTAFERLADELKKHQANNARSEKEFQALKAELAKAPTPELERRLNATREARNAARDALGSLQADTDAARKKANVSRDRAESLKTFDLKQALERSRMEQVRLKAALDRKA